MIEADEFDRSFHWLKPYMAVITSADPDHLDIYGTPEAYHESFEHFTSLIRPDGCLLMKQGINVTPRLQEGVKFYTYTGALDTKELSTSNSQLSTFYAENVRIGGGEIFFDFVGPDVRIPDIQLGVPVKVNVENGVAAIALAWLNGVTPEEIKRQEQLRYEAERDRMRANLLRSVSHDIRTPLTAIMGLSATVEDSETLTDEGRGMVEEIHQNAQWLLHLSENILSVTRFCDEGVVIEKSDEVVEEIVGSAIRRFRKNCDTDIPITVSKPEEILLAPMDATLIEQVLPVVLAVDVEQQRAQRAQLRRCDRDAADAAGRLALGRDLAADDELIVALDLVFLAPVPARVRVERRTDDRLFGAGAHELARGARAEDRVHGVHKDGFARARLAGQDVQAGAELQIRPLDDRDVFNMQFSQQSASPPAVSSKQLFDLVEKLIGGRIVLHEQKCRVVARKRADERVDAHTVERGACSRGEARQRLDDDDVLRLGIRRHTFPENFLQALIVAGKFVRRRCGVTVFPARRERLRQVQLLNVARQRRLRARNAALRQHIHELVLRLDLLLCNDLQNDVLSGGFHVVPPHSLSVSLPKAVS